MSTWGARGRDHSLSRLSSADLLVCPWEAGRRARVRTIPGSVWRTRVTSFQLSLVVALHNAATVTIAGSHVRID